MKKNSVFTQLPIRDFLKCYPMIASDPKVFPFLLMCLSDDSDYQYIVRYDGSRVEIGFDSDSWAIA